MTKQPSDLFEIAHPSTGGLPPELQTPRTMNDMTQPYPPPMPPTNSQGPQQAKVFEVRLTQEDIAEMLRKYAGGRHISGVAGGCEKLRRIVRQVIADSAVPLRSRRKSSSAAGLERSQVVQLVRLRDEQARTWKDLGQLFGISGAQAKNLYVLEYASRAGAKV